MNSNETITDTKQPEGDVSKDGSKSEKAESIVNNNETIGDVKHTEGVAQTDDSVKNAEERNVRHKMLQVERFLRKELRRFDLRHREQTIADVILAASFGFGKTGICIPKLDIFVEMTGITRGNVHTALKNLFSMDIITIHTTPKGPVYAINPNPNTWKCRERISRAQVRRAIDYLKMANGIVEEIEKDVAKAIEDIGEKRM